MKTRPLGKSGLSAPLIGLGTSKLTSVSTGLSRKEAFRLLETAEELGVTLFDTADSYGQGGAETLLGSFCKGKRDRFLISSKAGFTFGSAGGFIRLIKPIAKSILKRSGFGARVASSVRNKAPGLNLIHQSFDPAYIGSSIEGSLKRLRTDYLDLFFLHEPPAEVLRNEALADELQRRKQKGQLRCYGVSSGDPDVLGSAIDFPGLEIIQAPINPQTLPKLEDIMKRCAALGLGVLANQIFDSGRLLEGSQPQSREKLLRFAVKAPGVSTVIVGTLRPDHLEENVAAAESLRLTQ